MTPRRLFAFLAVFLAVAAAYFWVTWRDIRKEQAEQAAKRLYQIKEEAITALALKKGAEAIHLEKKGQDWQITKPLQTGADQDTVRSLLNALAFLNKERDLGQEKDLKPFGLDMPSFIVEFTADGKTRQLLLGNAAPGGRGYYALRDQSQDLMIISSADKQSLDRSLTALRDKTLFAFSPDKIKTVKIHLGTLQVNLERTAPDAWKWQGREQVKVRADRVDSLLRRLDLARIKEFVSESPGAKELAAHGLAPKPKGEVTLVEENQTQTILLGEADKAGVYARKGSAGPVFLVEERLKKDLEQTIAELPERRLWPGKIAAVQKVIWGPPDKVWTAVKEENSWKLSGPAQESLSQSAVRLEMALLKFQDLEYARLFPAGKPAEAAKYLLELQDASGKMLLRLGETGRSEEDKVEVSLEGQDKVERALVPLKAYRAWQEDMDRLTKKPQDKDNPD